MKYFLSSETKRYETTCLEEVINILTSEEEMAEEQFLVVERQNLASYDLQNYTQTTTNTGDEHLFWLEARQFHSDNADDFSHYRQYHDDVEPIVQAFSDFMNEQENYQGWENVTEEFK